MKPLILLIALLLASTAQSQPRKRALLIGINDYSASHLPATQGLVPAGREWPDLNGAVNDVDALRQMLTLVYGFSARDVVTLTNQQATRGAILQAIDRHLLEPAAKDDVLLFYFAGHGSQMRNTLSEEADRMDESLVPADSRTGARDIRDKELRVRFNTILDRGARLTVILDNCHSGSGARGLPTGARPRAVRPDLRDVAERTRVPRPEERGALVLSAAQDFDNAWEMRDEQRKFHGAFSWALLRALRDSGTGESATETFLRAQARLRGETPFQEPVLAGNAQARLRPLFGLRTDRRNGRTVVAVEKVQSDGTVALQGGWANGLSVGTELRLVEGAGGRAQGAGVGRLRITAIAGLGRSIASGRGVGLKPGALLEVAGWASPPGRPLRVRMPRISGSTQSIASLARRLHAEATRRRLRWIDDPLDATPAHLLRHGHRGWELLSSGHLQPLGIGDAAIAAIGKLPSGASLFVQFPAPGEMVDNLAAGIDGEGIEPTDHAEEADYVLLARFRRERLEYAWVRPAVTASDKRKTALPLRTDWLPVSTATMHDAILRLRRIHAWHQLDSPPEHRSPYRLAVRRMRDGAIASHVLAAGEEYDLVLRAAAPPSDQRYVYVFIIDSYGRSFLLFPTHGSVENRLPLTLHAPRHLPLGEDSAFATAPPYGPDTYFLLTTDEPLPNPWILEWDAVRTRTPRKPTPLEQLLSLARRSATVITYSRWSLEKVVYESVPPV